MTRSLHPLTRGPGYANANPPNFKENQAATRSIFKTPKTTSPVSIQNSHFARRLEIKKERIAKGNTKYTTNQQL
jgi:hypothetical protein